MIKKIAMVVAAFTLAGNAFAAGDAEAGKPLTAICGACHGADGNSLVPAFPKLAGQHASYLVKQMQDIQSGVRPVPEMTGMLDAMSGQDLENVAAFFASQTSSRGATKEGLVELGASIWRAGIREKGVAACSACHSPTGAGNGPAKYPMLSGQHADYIASALRKFRNDERTNDGDTRIMRDVAARLSDKELDAVASYASGLH